MRVEKRSAGAGADRHTPPGLLVGLIGLVLGVGLGLAIAWALWAGSGQTGARASSVSLRQWLKGLQTRSQIPVLALDLDFPAYQALMSPDFGLDGGADPVCVLAHATYDHASNAVTVCPSRAANILDNAPYPVLELSIETGNGLLPGVGRSLLWPAGTDAAASTGYLKALADLGLPVPAHETVRLTVNGSNWGFYAMEERWLVGGTSSDVTPGALAVTFEVPAQDVLSTAGFGGGFAHAELVWGHIPESEPAQLTSPETEAQATVEFQQLLQGEGAASELLNAERMGQFMAVTALWRGCLVPDWRTVSFVYDRSSSTFLPVASGLPQDDAMSLPVQLYDDPEVQRAYAQSLRAYGDSAYTDSVLAGSELELLDLAVGGWPWESRGLGDRLAQNQAEMRHAISPSQTLRAWHQEDAEALRLALEVTGPFAVEVIGLEPGEQGFVSLERQWVVPSDGVVGTLADSGVVLRGRVRSVPEIVTLRVPRVDLPDFRTNGAGDLRVVTRIWGLEDRVLVNVMPRSPYGVDGGP